MDFVFLDTSALVKLYHSEVGSTWLKAFVAGKQIGISELTLLEAATVLGRLSREAIYTKKQAAHLYAQIRQDRVKFRIAPLGDRDQMRRGITIAFNLLVNVRALDAIQTAAAIALRNEANLQVPTPVFTFVTADKNLLSAAQALGFITENPGKHT